MAFQHTAARRRLVHWWFCCATVPSFNTQPPEGGWSLQYNAPLCIPYRFNTQPPEGGWADGAKAMVYDILFQHTAARRRLDALLKSNTIPSMFQHTAARRRLAPDKDEAIIVDWFQHTAARRRLGFKRLVYLVVARVSTHSRPKAAGAA